MSEPESYDYIVVGAGAAGGVVAARLADHGHRVLLLEAGSEQVDASERLPGEAVPERSLAADYDVPAFHPFASEHPDIRWDFWVHHYKEKKDRERDPKYSAEHDGVLYPRCSTIGGCTAHNAMIVVRPSNADWNHIATTMNDPSWRASSMDKYFRRIEDCRHRPLHRLLARLGWNPTGHGWGGWLPTRKALPLQGLFDRRLRRTLLRSVERAVSLLPDGLDEWRQFQRSRGDPNDQRDIDENNQGISYLPLSTARTGRVGVRDLLHRVRAERPDLLTIQENALVTRIEIDRDTRRALGVVYRIGRKLYRAAPGANRAPGEERRARAAREVILSAGTFNTPQILMLSGIGDRKTLKEDHQIEVIEHLPSVGTNLQDRYEVGVVSKMKHRWRLMRGARFDVSDRHYRRFRRFGGGLYASNGGMLSVILRSRDDRIHPDLCCIAFLCDFRGYEPGYSKRVLSPDYLSWVVLKARTRNDAGKVTLASDDPTKPPHIEFNYFEDGSDTSGADLDDVVTGVKFVREVTDSIGHLVDTEEAPGRHRYTDEQLRDFVRETAWGHHACGTCAMKPRAQGGVVDSRFRVYGVENLRVVDASIFPKIPGFFIVSSVYMIAEKAADVILEDARAGSPRTSAP